jgi:hypothetical protein
MRATILQPAYLPWCGYFEMIASTDLYVIFDHVQFVRKSWHQRNRIKDSNGELLLTIPVKKIDRSTPIANIKISYDNVNPLNKHWVSITHAYKKAPYFNNYKSIFENIYNQKHERLRDLNVILIKAIWELLNISTQFIYSSDLDLKDEGLGKTERVVNLCKKVGITYLYDAKGAEGLLDEKLFKEVNIDLEFQNYKHPVYTQQFEEFIPYMSVIDLIFNEGPKSLEIIKSGRIE